MCKITQTAYLIESGEFKSLTDYVRFPSFISTLDKRDNTCLSKDFKPK